MLDKTDIQWSTEVSQIYMNEERVCCVGSSMALPCLMQLFICFIAIDLDLFVIIVRIFCSLNVRALQVKD